MYIRHYERLIYIHIARVIIDAISASHAECAIDKRTHATMMLARRRRDRHTRRSLCQRASADGIIISLCHTSRSAATFHATPITSALPKRAAEGIVRLFTAITGRRHELVITNSLVIAMLQKVTAQCSFDL